MIGYLIWSHNFDVEILVLHWPKHVNTFKESDCFCFFLNKDVEQ